VIHFDTSFVVDLLRERSRGEEGPAVALLASLGEDEVAISVFVACELFAGVALARREAEEREKVEALCAALPVRYPDEEFAESYGRIVGALRRSGQNTGAMDVLIATSAVREGARLVTRNGKDFSGVPGLDLISY
jgi:predicted nucleic acid-binding protein